MHLNSRRFGILLTAVALVWATAIHAQPSPRTAMGFTPWPVDFNEDGLTRTYAFARAHSNLMAHHFDGGIPWDEAHAGSEFPRHLRQDRARRLANTPRSRPGTTTSDFTPLFTGPSSARIRACRS